MEVKARYWGIGRPRLLGDSTRIGEVEIYETESDETEMAQISGTSHYSEWLSTIPLAPTLIESMDGDISTQQVITANIGRVLGIALDCGPNTAVRSIVLRNVNDLSPESFVPFAIDSLDYFIAGELNTGKIQRYSVMKLVEEDSTINLVYTILPLSDVEQYSIVQSFVRSVTKGASCQ